MRHLYNLLGLCIVSFLIVSCSGDGSKSAITEENIDKLLDQEIELDSILIEKGIVQKLDLVIENLVLSDKIIELLSKDSSLYTSELLHNPDVISRYATSKEKAVALGVYGADMNYVLHYEQTQKSFKYLLVSKGLAENIGVAMAFDEKTMKNYQENSSHKDSLINIVHTAYGNVKKHLKNSDQFLMSSLVIAGTWVENMYLATNHLVLTKDPVLKSELQKRILAQENYLGGVVILLKDLAPENDTYVISVVNMLDEVAQVLSDSPTEQEKIPALTEKITAVRDSLLLN